MAQKDLLLAIDNGTQSIRALIFDAQGELLAKERVIFQPYFSDQPGWAEQDPEIFWKSLCQACQGLWQKSGIDKERLAGVSLTTQRATIINVDRQGKPLRPAILWLDQRKTYGLPSVGGAWGTLFKLARVTDTIDYFMKEAEINWLRIHQPDIFKKTHKILLLSGYLTYRLTNEFMDSTGCQVGYIPFDYKKLEWAPSWDWKWKSLPVGRDLMPNLVHPGSKIGEITADAAAETGIPRGLPLIAAAADKACEVIGSGSLEPSTGCLSYGTTATVNVMHKKYIEAIPFLPPYPSAIPGYHTMEVQIFRGYWMVSWFKQEFCQKEQQEAAEMGVEPENIFENFLEEVSPGSMGLILQPYWSPGVRFPGHEAKGAVIGFGDVHRRSHLYRSILEGIAYALREGKERIEKRTGIPITHLVASGGGSQSRNGIQLTADIFGIPVARPLIYETSGLGAAIDAAVGLGFHKTFEEGVRAMTRTGTTFEPDMKNHEIYNALYEDVYKKMYKQLMPLYHRIREITGYPS